MLLFIICVLILLMCIIVLLFIIFVLILLMCIIVLWQEMSVLYRQVRIGQELLIRNPSSRNSQVTHSGHRFPMFLLLPSRIALLQLVYCDGPRASLQRRSDCVLHAVRYRSHSSCSPTHFLHEGARTALRCSQDNLAIQNLFHCLLLFVNCTFLFYGIFLYFLFYLLQITLQNIAL